MNQSKSPLWKKSILENLTYYDIIGWLNEISNDGDCYGYERGDTGYYNDYKELFDELSAAAYSLEDAMQNCDEYYHFGIEDDGQTTVWDDIMVSAIGELYGTLGYDYQEYDYYRIIDSFEVQLAQEEAKKRLMRLTKKDLLDYFCKVFQIMALFWDLKASHDCLTAVVDELDFKGALLTEKSSAIDKLYEEYTGRDPEEFDRKFGELTKNLPKRMWIE